MEKLLNVTSEFADELPLNAQLELASKAAADLRSKLAKIKQEQQEISERIAADEDVSGLLHQQQVELAKARRRTENGIMVMDRHAANLEGKLTN